MKILKLFEAPVRFVRSRTLCTFSFTSRISAKWMSTQVSAEKSSFRDIKVKNSSLRRYLEKLEENYNNSEESDKKLEPVISCLRKRREILSNMSSLSELDDEKDESLKALARDEMDRYTRSLDEIDTKIVELLMSNSLEDDCNAIVLEVNAGVGGQEAMLFAKELFDMYTNFAEYKGWEVEVAELALTDLGGIRHGSLLISGDSVFKFFKYEAGVHRVQRIPSTEKGGRIHTSTVSVLALPQPTDIQISLHQKDLRIDTKRASGAGGQHVNTTDSAVRITHLPTGVSVECQVDRSQIKNRAIAMTKLRTILYQRELDNQAAKIDATKKSQVRTNFRNEKIRTYNFSQDRITDHRLQENAHNLKGFMEGTADLEQLISKLDNHTKLEKLLEEVNKYN